jgi:mannosyltransferase
MKLILDNIIFFLQRSGGGSVYWIENILRLDRRDVDLEFTEPKGNSSNIFYNDFKGTLRHTTKKESFGAKILTLLAFRIKVSERYIFHSSYYRISTSSNAINVVTVHDFIPELYFKGLKRFSHSYRKRRAILKADGLICISEHTLKDLLYHYPQVRKKRIIVIPLGISNQYRTIDPQSYKIKGLPEKFVLFVGRRSYYKNFLFAVSVLKRLHDYHLVVVGERFTESENNYIKPIRDRCFLMEDATNEVVNELYNRAFCLLYPSSYEGFGIPVVEAMKCGCPVVGLNASSLPEIANGAALLLDELAPEPFSKAILSLENAALREAIVERGKVNSLRFSWENAERSLFYFYESLFADGK